MHCAPLVLLTQVLVFFCVPWALVGIIVTLLVASRVLRMWRKNRKSGRLTSVRNSRTGDVARTIRRDVKDADMSYNDKHVDEENLRCHDPESNGNLVKDA